MVAVELLMVNDSLGFEPISLEFEPELVGKLRMVIELGQG